MLSALLIEKLFVRSKKEERLNNFKYKHAMEEKNPSISQIKS